MKTSLARAASALASAGAVAAAAAGKVSTVAMPLYLRWGPDNHRVSTDLVVPYENRTIEVEYDTGSADFWLFQNNSIMNWGCPYLLCQGQCNVSVNADITYDPYRSATASPVERWDAQYGYGGGLFKVYRSNAIVNDTFTFANPAGLVTEVADVRVALAQYLQQRIRDNGTCAPVPTYTRAILGLSPYWASASPSVLNTTGPSFRQNLLEAGRIQAPVQSLWFEQRPDGAQDTFTGVGLLGGIDTSKYTGPLVKIPRLFGPFSYNGYYTYAANLSYDGVTFANAPIGSADGNLCLLDTGTSSDGINPADSAFFFNVTGLRENPQRRGGGYDLAWPGPCNTIPADRFLEFHFDGVDPAEHLVVKVPLRSYHRYQDPGDEALGWCTMNLMLRSCTYGMVFHTAAFWAADDETGEMAVAQGGIAPRGSGVDEASVVLRIP